MAAGAAAVLMTVFVGMCLLSFYSQKYFIKVKKFCQPPCRQIFAVSFVYFHQQKIGEYRNLPYTTHKICRKKSPFPSRFPVGSFSVMKNFYHIVRKNLTFLFWCFIIFLHKIGLFFSFPRQTVSALQKTLSQAEKFFQPKGCIFLKPY